MAASSVALSLNARIVVMDEPTAALDGDNCALVESLLRDRLNAGDAILLVSHDPAQIARLARRRLHLVGGQLAGGS